jgi:phosphocarrier protein FPr/phosphocarrier protein
MPSLTLQAPIDGWCAPLAEVPDQVFAEGMVGDGMAIDPVSGVVCSPCDGEIIAVPAGGHAVSIRAAPGVEVLVHVGIDSVKLLGHGFEALARIGQRVRAGEELIRFDLDIVARGAKSLMTPVVLAPGGAWRIRRRHAPGRIRTGEMLLDIDIDIDVVADEAATRCDLRPTGPLDPGVAARGEAAHGQRPPVSELTRTVVMPLLHGLHARPAALLSKRASQLDAKIAIAARGKLADARSVTAIMALGVGHGDEIQVVANGADAAAAIDALLAGIEEAVRLEKAAGDHANPAVVAAHSSGVDAAMRASVTARGPDDANPAPSGRATLATSVPRSRAGAPAFDKRPAPAPAGKPASAPSGVPSEPGTLSGAIAVRGFALGQVARIERAQIDVVEKGSGIARERAELERARNSVRARLSRVAGAGGGARREIADAHVAFLDDPALNESAIEYIAVGKSAAFAWRAAVRTAIETLTALGDARMRERADDLLDIESHVLLALAGEARPMNMPLPEEAIVVAEDLLPSELVSLDRANLRAICLAGGGPTSHVAILAGAMDVPMLVGIGPALQSLKAGTRVIVDAERGVVHIAPPTEELAKAERRATELRQQRAAERQAAQVECRTKDGTRIEVFANLGSLEEAEAAVEAGAEGCGLLRTEFLFIDRDSAPDEDEQFSIYQGIATALGGKPLVLRLMDVGGDKPLAYLPLPHEENPALGLRGVRTALRHPDLLRTQLRAALRVQPHVRVLVPMVTDVADVHAVRNIIDELQAGLGGPERIEIGAMIETPAAALTADRIAEHVDFLSIGSNDLTQYSLAMDRGHPELARRIDALHPAVLKLIALAGAAGESCRKTVAVCGGIGSDPTAIPLLIGLGVRELSVVPAAIAAIKHQVRTLDVRDCAALAARALEARSAADVRSLVAEAKLSPGGLS